MSVIKSEFYLALNQVATERGISPDDVIESMKVAVLAAYKKDYLKNEEENETDIYEVRINKESGETKVFKNNKDITPPGFGRIAAQTARQVILQKIREVEKKTIVKHYADQLNTIIKGRVIRYDGRNAYIDIGKAEGVLPQEEQIRNELYKLNDSLIVYIKEIKEDNFGNSRIIVSRSDIRLIEELFKKEVPEVTNGVVKIVKVVREAGERSKIAVFSDQSGVDPVGACVGQKGVRVKNVTDQIGGDEKIDIIQFNNEPTIFIKEALSPATVSNIEIDKKNKIARVAVDEKQIPLAIGKNGVNVNLASRLTDYTIDIIQLNSDNKPEEKKEVEEDVKEEIPEEKKEVEEVAN